MNMYDAGVSLSGFACFVTPDLARDLANDVMSLVSFECTRTLHVHVSTKRNSCCTLWLRNISF